MTRTEQIGLFEELNVLSVVCFALVNKIGSGVKYKVVYSIQIFTVLNFLYIVNKT